MALALQPSPPTPSHRPTNPSRPTEQPAWDLQLARAAGAQLAAQQPWADPAALAPLLARHGLVATISSNSLVQRGASLESWVAGNVESHPWWRTTAARLEPAALDAVLAETTEIARRANEDPAGLALTMDYRLIVARRTGRLPPGRRVPGAKGVPPTRA